MKVNGISEFGERQRIYCYPKKTSKAVKNSSTKEAYHQKKVTQKKTFRIELHVAQNSTNCSIPYYGLLE